MRREARTGLESRVDVTLEADESALFIIVDRDVFC